MEKLVLEKYYKIVVPLFGYAAPNKGTTLILIQVSINSVESTDFSRPLSNFPVLFKADLIFKGFSRNSSKFKYYLSLCETLK